VSFRLRVTLAAAVAVALAVAAASAVVYVVVRHQLYGEVDRSLVTRAHQFAERPGRDFGPGIVPVGPDRGISGSPYLQVISTNGDGSAIELPCMSQAEDVAAGSRRPFFCSGTIRVSSDDGGIQSLHVRVYAEKVADGFAAQVARPLDEVDHTLGRLGTYLLIIGVGGVVIAGALGMLVGAAALRPVGQLTEVAEEVAATRDLSRRIETSSRDELGRLATAFNQMLTALDNSVRAQRQLVADASHELRTPLASLRTNVEVLVGGKTLPDEERNKLLADVIGQVEELSTLVGDLVEIDRAQTHEVEDIRLDELVSAAIGRARVRTPRVSFRANLSESVVRGSRSQLDRAVSNLLDNAAKWSDSVDVSVAGTEVTVRDHGPGIAEEDLPHVFDRFYRAADARHLPGSGLGLAIVRQVAQSHGGEATAENAPDGGAVFHLRLAAGS
jgi:two-component system, OmpR family, sensor histidine kinase MprB